MVKLVASESNFVDGNGREPFQGTKVNAKNAFGLRDSIQSSGIVNPKGALRRNHLVEPWSPVERVSFALPWCTLY